MATVRDKISAALREIGVLHEGEVPTATQATEGLETLNAWVDQCAAERLQIYQVVRTTWVITSGTQSYAVASGSVVNVARPVFVNAITFSDSATSPALEYPMTPLTDEGYASVRIKTLTSPYPYSYYYSPTFPTGTISLFPIPTATTLTGVLYAPQAVAQFTSINNSLALPPGYDRMLTKNLALELCPSYGVQPNPLLVQQARDSKASVRQANIRLEDMHFGADALVGGSGGSGEWAFRTGYP